MKIHFSNVNFSSRSGPNTFAHRLAGELVNMGHSIVDASDYDSALVFIEPSTNLLPGKRVVHRLDGIWFKPEEFEVNNRLIKSTYDSADWVVWQSDFDKSMTTSHWGLRKGSVIRNGIDLSHPVPKVDMRDIRSRFDTVFVASANWHRQKRLKEVHDLFLYNRQFSPKSCLIVLGSNPDYVTREEGIFYAGSLPHESCLAIFEQSDWMIHLAWLDHCPNVVVEALSRGCPVICTDSGGTSELVGRNGIVIPETVRYNFELLDYDNPPPLGVGIQIPEKIKVDNSDLDIRKVAKQYEGVLAGDI